MAALDVPVEGRFGSRFLPKSAAGPRPCLLCMGLFSRFLSRPPRGIVAACRDLEVVAAGVIGLMLVRTLPGPTGSR